MTARRGGAGGTLLIGTESPLTAAVLDGLAEAAIELSGVVVYGGRLPDPRLPVRGAESRPGSVALANRYGLPLRGCRDVADPGLADWIAERHPDYLLVACFPRRLPRSVRALARHDCLNLHPSLLPRYRGPAPLFWQLRAAEPATGISLHRLVDAFDAGPLAGRERVALPDGADGAELDRLLGAAGARLYAASLRRAGGGAFAARSQDETRASYHPIPAPQDFRVSPAWSARRIFNFMRGTRHWGRPYPVALDDRELLLGEALDCRPGETQAAACVVDGDTLRLRCGSGVLVATVVPPGSS